MCIGTLGLGAGVWIGSTFAGGRSGQVWSEGHREPTREPVRTAAPPSFADLVERVGPGVVSVRALVPTGEVVPAAGDGEASLGVRNGSGFVVSPTGLVVTARHLTVRASRIMVELPHLGRYDAALVGEDEVTDIAVLRLANAPPHLPALDLGYSEDLRAGDWIVAVGNPFGFKQTVTAGVVSFVGRHLHHYDVRVSSEFLQFSAPVNPGSSGSPVIDLAGRVVGVTTQAADAAQGISFAIPSRTLKWVLDAMDQNDDGRVHRGHLGISFDSRTGVDDRGRPLQGAIVYEVAPGGAAAGVGLEAGDVVLLVDGQAIDDAGDLHERITRTVPGASVHLTVLRSGRMLEPIAVTLRDASLPRDRDGEMVH